MALVLTGSPLAVCHSVLVRSHGLTPCCIGTVCRYGHVELTPCSWAQCAGTVTQGLS